MKDISKQCNFALVSIGTKKLDASIIKALKAGNVPITITGTITEAWGGYDGIDREWCIKINKAEIAL